MITKKIIWIVTTLVILLLVFANIPSISAHTPVSPPDPALDPTEGLVFNALWSVNWGHSINYGSYIRDVQWDSALNTPPGTLNRYLGMLNIPYITISGTNYMFAAGAIGKVFTAIALPGHFSLTYTYPPIIDGAGDTHTVNIVIDIHDTPPFSPAGFPADACITITATDTYVQTGGGGPKIFGVPVRADFDIDGLATPGADIAYIYQVPGGGGPPPTWVPQGIETQHGPLGLAGQDPTYGMEVMQDDFFVSTMWMFGPWASGPWGGIVPFATAGANPDTFYLVAYNVPPPFEYLGPPILYLNAQGIGVQDVVIWDETAIGFGAAGSYTINLRIWIV